jgi:hypothetical protein
LRLGAPKNLEEGDADIAWWPTHILIRSLNQACAAFFFCGVCHFHSPVDQTIGHFAPPCAACRSRVALPNTGQRSGFSGPVPVLVEQRTFFSASALVPPFQPIIQLPIA